MSLIIAENYLEQKDVLFRNYQQQYNPYNIASATAAYGSINWKSYLGQLFNGVVDATKQVNYNVSIVDYKTYP